VKLACYIDHTLLKADATPAQVEALCHEAREHGFASVCVNAFFVPRASKLLKGSGVKVCTVVGFPLGASPTSVKLAETTWALERGAQEIDMVISIAGVKAREWDYVEDDIRQLAEACHKSGAILKVILEMCLLTQEEKIHCCELAWRAGADFVKTSTGFSTGGATVADVELMRTVVGSNLGIKASGGIKDTAFAQELIAKGATRLGTSAGVQLVKTGVASGGY